MAFNAAKTADRVKGHLKADEELYGTFPVCRREPGGLSYYVPTGVIAVTDRSTLLFKCWPYTFIVHKLVLRARPQTFPVDYFARFSRLVVGDGYDQGAVVWVGRSKYQVVEEAASPHGRP